MKKFSKGEAVKFGWETTKRNFGFLLSVLVITFLIALIPVAIDQLFGKKFWALSFMVNISGMILNMILTMGLIKIALNFCDNKESKLSDLFSCVNFFFEYLFSSILYFLIIVGTSILFIFPIALIRFFVHKFHPANLVPYSLIIPGLLSALALLLIILAIKFQFFSYFIVDKDTGPIQALKMSSSLTRGIKWDLFLFAILLGLVNLLGFLALVIGLLGTIPTTMVATAFVYRKLVSNPENT